MRFINIYHATVALAAVVCVNVNAQSAGTSTAEYHMPFPLSTCVPGGTCTTVQQSVTLDANWRWSHNKGGYTNCYTGNTWSSTYCPDAATCTANCVVEGVSSAQFGNPYGITQVSNGIKLQFVTAGQYGNNVGSRVFLLDSSGSRYQPFKLKNKEFTFDVDASQLPCGLNGALYFVEMDLDGGVSKYPTNTAGAKYGTGYCDAQCPHDIKWIQGQANSQGWTPSSTDQNAGSGLYGTCCTEMDIWEANSISTAVTPHPCSVGASYKCSGVDCGDDATGQRYQGVCDKDGCDINTWRMGNKNFYGPGTSFTIDTTKPVTVVTQFITDDGTDTGNLVEIKRFWVQNGVTFSTPNANVGGLSHNSITDNTCANQKSVFGENNQFAAKGGLKALGDSMDRGWTLVMSIWDDHAVNMLWLDGITFPTNKDPSALGVSRGSCATTSGAPADVEANSPYANVKFSNIKIGPLGSTFKAPTVASTQAPTSAQTAAPTNQPTNAPTKQPTAATSAPTNQPTNSPTKQPTAATPAPTNTPSPTSAETASPTASTCKKVWQQCGGTGYSGATCCQSGYVCNYIADYFSQCWPQGWRANAVASGEHEEPKTLTAAFIFAGSMIATAVVVLAVGVTVFYVRRRHRISADNQASEVFIPMQ